MDTHTHTHIHTYTQDNYSNLAAHARRGLIIRIIAADEMDVYSLLTLGAHAQRGLLCPLHHNLKNCKSRCESNDKNEQYGILTSR